MTRTVFVGGPIQYALSGDEFLAELKEILEALLDALAGHSVLSAYRYEGYGKMDVEGEHFAVARRDHDGMTACDVFVAALPNNASDEPMRTDRTCVELGWAPALGRPVDIVRDLGTTHSHLVKGLGAIAVVEELDMAEARLEPARLLTAIDRLTRPTAAPHREAAR